ncbi:MAG: MoxR family ATPase [Treponema sp.]|jgi:MoxR-like ATPase|nr:MoxR family ATPase [Treponema sp.]
MAITTTEAGRLLQAARAEMAKRIIGQQDMVDALLAALIAGGHVLLEGPPGLAKTRAVKCLAQITGLSFKRIQFTPDLLPADITGTLVWDQAGGGFSVRKGPVFANLILADEINRAPAKVQSALLEAMEERQVTIGETAYPLPDPFFVMATENPIEHEGTYALPEAELDRFLLKTIVPYPSAAEEEAILGFAGAFSRGKRPDEDKSLAPVLGAGGIERLREAADTVFLDEKIAAYIVSLSAATRPVPGVPPAAGDVRRLIAFGASPRASLCLHRVSRVYALFAGRAFVSIEDVKAAAPAVLRHRIVRSYEADAENKTADDILARILRTVPVP